MPNINSQVQASYDPNILGSVINNPNNIFNNALSSLPDTSSPPTDVVENIPTESVINTTDNIFVDYTVTSSLADRTFTLSELDLVIPSLIQNNIKYGHTLYAGNVDYTSWLSTNPACCDVNYTIFEQKLKQHLSSWSLLNPEYSQYYDGDINTDGTDADNGAPTYIVNNQFHTSGVFVELQEIITVEEDITSGRGLRAFNMLTGLLNVIKSAYPSSKVSQYMYPYLPFYFLPRADGGDACTWSYKYNTVTAEEYETEKARLIGLLKDKVASFLSHTDIITTAHYATYSEEHANKYQTDIGTTPWVYNNCKAIVEASGGKPVSVYTCPIVFPGSEFTLEELRENNFNLPLDILKKNVQALPKLVASTPYMDRIIFKPMRKAGVKHLHLWASWLYTHYVAKLTPIGSSTFGITDADIYLSRKTINDLFVDQNIRSPIALDDGATWNLNSTREDVLLAALSKDIEMANAFRTDSGDNNESIWAASWSSPSNSAFSVVPMVFVDGFYGGPGTTDSSDDLVSTENYNTFKSKLLSLPVGRRLIQPRFWANVPWNFGWDDIEKLKWTMESDGINFGGEKMLFTPWYDETITHAKGSVNDFFQKCQADNLTFDYIVDNSAVGDGESANIFKIGVSPRVGDCPGSNPTSPAWQKCVCGLRHYTCFDWASENILEGIVNDSRFTTKVNPLNGLTIEQDFYNRYSTIMDETLSLPSTSYFYKAFGGTSWYDVKESNAIDALTPLFGFIENTLPWTSASKNAATRAWNGVVNDWGNLYYRLELFKDALDNNGYSNIKISEYQQYPMSSDEMFYTEDLNSWQDGPRDDNSRFYISPKLYGEVSNTEYFAYKLNALTDKEKYGFIKINPSVSTPFGYKRIDQPSWLAFLLDIRKTRSILRSSQNNWQKLKPWIISPTYNINNNFRYASDTQYGRQYWKELIFHLCLNGTTTFHYFNENTESADILHGVLDEWRIVTSNSSSSPVNLTRIQVSSNVIISGGRMSNTGNYIWRITAKPSESRILKAFGSSASRTDIPQEIIIPNYSRGVWLETTTSEPPLYVLDEDNQNQNNETLYVTEIDYNLRTTRLEHMRAMFGGNNNDYGTGISVSGGNSSGAINYLKSANVLPEERWYESSDTFAYEFIHELNNDGTPKQHVVKIDKDVDGNDIFETVPSCSVLYYESVPCYNSAKLKNIQFAKEMAKTGEWGPPMRAHKAWPNDPSHNSRKTNYITSLLNGQEIVHSGLLTYDASLFDEYPAIYNKEITSFWKRSTEDPLPGRMDLAFNYDGQGTISLVPGHEKVILFNNLQLEIDGSSGEDHVKMEPGSTWKYIGNSFAPIRADDGCADSIYISHALEGLTNWKHVIENTYKTHTNVNAPSGVYRSSAYTNLMDEYFESGVYKPKILHIDIEDHLTNAITNINITYRAGPNQYGGIGQQLITNNIWQRIVSQVKLMRKLTHYARQIYGEQVKIFWYNPIPFIWWHEWSPGWYPTDGAPSLWSDVRQTSQTECPFCSELNIGYQGDAWFNSLSNSDKVMIIEKAINELRNRVFKIQNAFAKMFMFENGTGAPDVLDLRADLKSIMPQIDEEHFIIEGLNHYSNSASDFLTQSTYKAYATTGGVFVQDKEPYPKPTTTANNNKAHANFVRAAVKNGKEMVRTGKYKNQIFGQMYTHTIQGNCGSDVAQHTYEYWNCDLKTESGYIKNWDNYNRYTAVELNQFDNAEPGERDYGFHTVNAKNVHKASLARHLPTINMSNDELNRGHLAMSNAVGSEAIFSWNPALSYVIGSISERFVSTPKKFDNQYRPCTAIEEPNAISSDNPGGIKCTPISKYVKPKPITNNFKLRVNDYDTFSCDSSTETPPASARTLTFVNASPTGLSANGFPAGASFFADTDGEYIEITTNPRAFNNRGAIRNELPNDTGDVWPKELRLSELIEATLEADVQVTSFPLPINNYFSAMQCTVGFNKNRLCFDQYAGNTGYLILVGFRVSENGTWVASVTQDYCLLTDMDIEQFPTGSYCKRAQEMFAFDTNQSIFDRCKLKVVVNEGKIAKYYVNDTLVATITAQDLQSIGYNVEYLVTNDNAIWGSLYSGPTINPITGTENVRKPQKVFAGVEVRHLKPPYLPTDTSNFTPEPISIRVYNINGSKL